MIGMDELVATRREIHEEIRDLHGGSPFSWGAQEDVNLEAVEAWATTDYEEHLKRTGAPLEPPMAMVIGVQIGLRLGRKVADGNV